MKKEKNRLKNYKGNWKNKRDLSLKKDFKRIAKDVRKGSFLINSQIYWSVNLRNSLISKMSKKLFQKKSKKEKENVKVLPNYLDPQFLSMERIFGYKNSKRKTKGKKRKKKWKNCQKKCNFKKEYNMAPQSKTCFCPSFAKDNSQHRKSGRMNTQLLNKKKYSKL